MIKSFMEHIHIKGKLWKCMAMLIGAALLYSILYQFVMPLIYQNESAVLFYGMIMVMTLFTGCLTMIIVCYLATVKKQETSFRIRPLLLPGVVTLGLLNAFMLGLGVLSFQLALTAGTGVMAYVVNALLVSLCMLYFPVSLFALLEIYQGQRNPLMIVKNSFGKILHHYQSVFYSCLLIAVLAFGYRYLMNALYSFQLGVTLYDLPLELLTRMIPFLDVPDIVLSLSGNSQMWGVLAVSFAYQVFLCVAYIFFIFYMICIHDEDISV